MTENQFSDDSIPASIWFFTTVFAIRTQIELKLEADALRQNLQQFYAISVQHLVAHAAERGAAAAVDGAFGASRIGVEG